MIALYVILIMFVLSGFLSLVVAIWSAKITHGDNKTKSTVIYGVYKELKRYNDVQERKSDDEVNSRLGGKPYDR